MEAAESAQGGCGDGNNGPILPFNMEFVGRPVCSDDDPQGGPTRALPSAHLHTQQILDFFEGNFGFTERETAAILGAHTL